MPKIKIWVKKTFKVETLEELDFEVSSQELKEVKDRDFSSIENEVMCEVTYGASDEIEREESNYNYEIKDVIEVK